ncbi:MAG: transglycosylase SLT domain-containing protein [Chiayiivirga sp.]|jgi:membrane-bound lytic murein transglycosylase D|uniref:transglycosylase SLT domain-containing protein n=1 Tax=Chiayiivirga sp. TaxID=2041042 RepID=UPI0025B8BB42|nr:transglycosylase SLT domain-containing protein [Chiayiivirga sp.]MCI1710206.1 transglycosylase SLT domain-containing protein [Chiayiivirga sp.]MCI1728994.1 transglycosylase SLT domain-containing protein [Chiayiivirga sp.]
MTLPRHLAIAPGIVLAAALTACQAPTRPAAPLDASPPERHAHSVTAPAIVVEDPANAAAPADPALHEGLPRTTPASYLHGEDVYARLTARLADPPCVEDRVVQRWEHTYGRWPPRFAAQLEAVLPLMAMTLDEIETHHLPGEFALLPIVESWYRPDAGSAATAYGLWQFTSATARHQGLRIVPGFDERLAPQAATRAAMRYLAELQNHFGDWKLADMAFNAGEYRIVRALARSKPEQRTVSAAAHLPPGLSMTTYEHVAKVQALACLITQPQRFGIELPRRTRIEPLQAVTLPPGIATLDAVASRAEIPVAELRRLNPAFLQGRVVAAARRELILPRSAAKRLAEAPAPYPLVAVVPVPDEQRPPDTARTHRVERGDTLSGISTRYGVRLRDLLRWNRIDVRALLHPGQRLRLEP